MNATQRRPMVLIGLDQIGKAFRRSRWTIKRWARREGFPIARLPDGQWCTTASLIDAWLIARNKADPLAKPNNEDQRRAEAQRSR